MIRNTRFWTTMVVFQIVFGLTIFGITRQYYVREGKEISASPTGQPAAEWPDLSGESDLENSIFAFTGTPATNDPVALSRQADESFANRKFDQAADLYARLLAADPGNVDTYNNLGLTLHYLGRSAEALRVLNEGVRVDSEYQRIWLTLGYVNNQLGNIDQARSALSTAVQKGPNTEVGQSAAKMLDALN